MTESVPHLLITYEYDQHRMDGPPFSISPEEVKQHYEDSYDITLLGSAAVTGKLKERLKGESVAENIWRLLPDHQKESP